MDAFSQPGKLGNFSRKSSAQKKTSGKQEHGFSFLTMGRKNCGKN